MSAIAVAFKVVVPTEVLMVIEGEFCQSLLFVCFFAPWLILHAFCHHIFKRKKNRKYHQSVKQFVSRSGPTFYYQYMNTMEHGPLERLSTLQVKQTAVHIKKTNSTIEMQPNIVLNIFRNHTCKLNRQKQ